MKRIHFEFMTAIVIPNNIKSPRYTDLRLSDEVAACLWKIFDVAPNRSWCEMDPVKIIEKIDSTDMTPYIPIMEKADLPKSEFFELIMCLRKAAVYGSAANKKIIFNSHCPR